MYRIYHNIFTQDTNLPQYTTTSSRKTPTFHNIPQHLHARHQPSTIYHIFTQDTNLPQYTTTSSRKTPTFHNIPHLHARHQPSTIYHNISTQDTNLPQYTTTSPRKTPTFHNIPQHLHARHQPSTIYHNIFTQDTNLPQYTTSSRKTPTFLPCFTRKQTTHKLLFDSRYDYIVLGPGLAGPCVEHGLPPTPQNQPVTQRHVHSAVDSHDCGQTGRREDERGTQVKRENKSRVVQRRHAKTGSSPSGQLFLL